MLLAYTTVYDAVQVFQRTILLYDRYDNKAKLWLILFMNLLLSLIAFTIYIRRNGERVARKIEKQEIAESCTAG